MSTLKPQKPLTQEAFNYWVKEGGGLLLGLNKLLQRVRDNFQLEFEIPVEIVKKVLEMEKARRGFSLDGPRVQCYVSGKNFQPVVQEITLNPGTTNEHSFVVGNFMAIDDPKDQYRGEKLQIMIAVSPEKRTKGMRLRPKKEVEAEVEKQNSGVMKKREKEEERAEYVRLNIERAARYQKINRY